MRVIPDVDVNAERSEKQKEESNKFGFLSDMLNQNLEYLKIGFPKVYQPLNYAIKKNIPFVSKTENGFEFDFPKAVFSEGKLALCSINYFRTQNTTSARYSLRININNDFPSNQENYDDQIVFVLFIKELNKLFFYTINNNQQYKRGSFLTSHSVYIFNLYDYNLMTAQISMFFFNKNSCSKSFYIGEIQLRWN